MIPDKIRAVNVPQKIFRDTIENFQKDRIVNRERIAYWAGALSGNSAMIKSVIFADNYAEFENDRFFASMPLEATLKVGEEIHKRSEVLIAQIHSHPKEAFHSLVDDEHPISHRIGFLSIVVPNYGRNVNNFENCKIFEYHGNGSWHELSSQEVLDRFTICR